MNINKKFSEYNPLFKNDDYGQGTQSINSLDDLSKLAILHEVGLAITQLLDLEKILDFTEDASVVSFFGSFVGLGASSLRFISAIIIASSRLNNVGLD